MLPKYGAKITEILDKRISYQWLWTDPSRPIHARGYLDNYADHDISGFDECFPNIGISPYPADTSKTLPDHGELWTQSWDLNKSENTLVTSARGQVAPYIFKRTLSLNGDVISFAYEIENLGMEKFLCFWSAHPLFRANEGMRIEIAGNPSMRKEFGFSGRMGDDGIDGYGDHLKKYTWPKTHDSKGGVHDLSLITFEQPMTDKVILEAPSDGMVRLVDPTHRGAIAFTFNPAEIPYVGICFNLNAWPFEGEKGRWVAIEPTQGATDRLDESEKLGAFLSILPQSTVHFGFTLRCEVL